MKGGFPPGCLVQGEKEKDAASETAPRAAAADRYFLESLLEDGARVRRIVIQPVPFRVGRRPGADLMLPFESVSKLHAELYREGDVLRLRDLGSTNGTFVNRTRITDAPVRRGDILHFAEFEFRLGAQSQDAGRMEDTSDPETLSLRGERLPRRFEPGTSDLEEMLRTEAVVPVFQRIVSLPGRELAGLEVLGRGRSPSLPEAPAELLRIARSAGLEGRLARLFRRVAAEATRGHAKLPPLFLNCHPGELGQPGLIESLIEVQRIAPGIDLYLEIHEGALANPGQIALLQQELRRLGIGLAYDDFGAGQARLLELAEVPPDFLKFDHRFVHGIDRAVASRRRLLSGLVEAATDLGVSTIAEGIETAEEAEVCAEAGFSHAQGFFFGSPFGPERLGEL